MPARLWRAVRTTLGLGVLAAASLVLAPAGLAHDQLIASTPAAGEALPTPPAEVVLTMSGDALDIGTTVMVTDLDGADHAGAITIAGPDVRVEVADLEDGFYDVRWRIVSSDGHPVSGVVPFSVGDVGDRPTAQPDTGPAEASGQATANPHPPATTTTTSPTTVPTRLPPRRPRAPSARSRPSHAPSWSAAAVHSRASVPLPSSSRSGASATAQPESRRHDPPSHPPRDRHSRRRPAGTDPRRLLLRRVQCDGAEATETTESAQPTESTDDAGEATDATLTFQDAWTKAAETGMTAAFGTLVNPTDADLQVIGVSSPAATTMELHETVMSEDSMMMQQVEGFTIPAGGELLLEPGGNHLMFMGLTEPILPGDEVEVTLELQDGSTVTFVTSAREFTGADEEYAGEDMDMDHDHEDGDDHSDHDH